MPKPFDATLKHLLEQYPRDWLRLMGLNVEAPVDVIDADIATVSAAADKVFHVRESSPWLLHLELQASYDADLGRRLHRYNALLDSRHDLPTRSVAVLLRSEADGKEMTGVVERRFPNDAPYLNFRYEIIRVWQLTPDQILQAGVGTLPLLPLSRTSRKELPRLIREMDSRLRKEARRADVDSLWTATYVLMGLEYEKSFASQLLAGVRSMKESVTYQAILEEGRAAGIAQGIAKGRVEGHTEGRAEEAQRILLAQGTKRFGRPSPKTRKKIAAISDPDVLEQLATRLLDAEGWDDLLGL